MLSSRGMRNSARDTTSKHSIGWVGSGSSPATWMATPSNYLPNTQTGSLLQARRLKWRAVDPRQIVGHEVGWQDLS